MTQELQRLIFRILPTRLLPPGYLPSGPETWMDLHTELFDTGTTGSASTNSDKRNVSGIDSAVAVRNFDVNNDRCFSNRILPSQVDFPRFEVAYFGALYSVAAALTNAQIKVGVKALRDDDDAAAPPTVTTSSPLVSTAAANQLKRFSIVLTGGVNGVQIISGLPVAGMPCNIIVERISAAAGFFIGHSALRWRAL